MFLCNSETVDTSQSNVPDSENEDSNLEEGTRSTHSLMEKEIREGGIDSSGKQTPTSISSQPSSLSRSAGKRRKSDAAAQVLNVIAQKLNENPPG